MYNIEIGDAAIGELKAQAFSVIMRNVEIALSAISGNIGMGASAAVISK